MKNTFEWKCFFPVFPFCYICHTFTWWKFVTNIPLFLTEILICDQFRYHCYSRAATAALKIIFIYILVPNASDTHNSFCLDFVTPVLKSSFTYRTQNNNQTNPKHFPFLKTHLSVCEVSSSCLSCTLSWLSWHLEDSSRTASGLLSEPVLVTGWPGFVSPGRKNRNQWSTRRSSFRGALINTSHRRTDRNNAWETVPDRLVSNLLVEDMGGIPTTGGEYFRVKKYRN